MSFGLWRAAGEIGWLLGLSTRSLIADLFGHVLWLAKIQGLAERDVESAMNALMFDFTVIINCLYVVIVNPQ